MRIKLNHQEFSRLFREFNGRDFNFNGIEFLVSGIHSYYEKECGFLGYTTNHYYEIDMVMKNLIPPKSKEELAAEESVRKAEEALKEAKDTLEKIKEN